MRVLFTLVMLGLVATCIAQEKSNKEFAKSTTLAKTNGCYLFIMSEPAEDYDHVGTISLPDRIFSKKSKVSVGPVKVVRNSSEPIFNKEVENLIHKARKKYPYFNGIIIYRDFKTATLINFRGLEFTSAGFKIGEKVVYKTRDELIYGEIKSIDTYRSKATFSYINIYGEEKVIERKTKELTPLSEEQYEKNLAEHMEKVALYKYEIGEFATWKKGKEILFGEIRALNDKNHKASIEFLDIYGDKNTQDVPYLDIKIIDADKYNSLLTEWNTKVAEHQFEIGEKVKWIARESARPGAKKIEFQGEIVNLNDKTHQAEIKYTDEAGEEKITKRNYLKINKT